MSKKASSAEARLLRRNMTEEERYLWRYLRAKRFEGFKFRRQEPIGPFIVDFVCFEHKLIIELDGGYHIKTKDYDKSRSLWLESQGFKVIRYWNDTVHEKRDQLLESIQHHLEDLKKTDK